MEPEDTLLSSQQPASGANHEPEHPSSHPSITFVSNMFRMLSFRCMNLTETETCIQAHSVLRTILVIFVSYYASIHSVSFSLVVARRTRKLSHDLRAMRYRECMKRRTAYFNKAN